VEGLPSVLTVRLFDHFPDEDTRLQMRSATFAIAGTFEMDGGLRLTPRAAAASMVLSLIDLQDNDFAKDRSTALCRVEGPEVESGDTAWARLGDVKVSANQFFVTYATEWLKGVALAAAGRASAGAGLSASRAPGGGAAARAGPARAGVGRARGEAREGAGV
jgi:poly-gamma-glutamate capsule biosynthesis protein CapA/YwtB (metallophosphatase superfamily)